MDTFYTSISRQAVFALLGALLAAIGIGLLLPYLPIAGVAVGLSGLFLIVLFGTSLELLVNLWILLLPFYAYRFEIGPVTGNLYRVMFIVLLLVLPFQLYGFRFRKRHLKIYLSALLLFVLFMLDLLRSFSSDLAISSFLSHTFGLGAFIYLVYFVSNKKRLRMVTNAYLVSSIIVAGYGVYEGLSWFLTGSRPSLPFAQYASTDIAFKSSMVGAFGLPRVESFFHDANLLGIYVLISFLLLISRLQRSVSVSRSIILVGALVMEGLCILFTSSRSAIGLLAITFLLLLFFDKQAFSKRVIRWSTRLFTIFSLAVISYLTVPVISTYMEAIFYRFSAGIDATRITLGQGGWEAFLSSPIIGVGLSELESRLGLYTTHSFYITVLAKYGLLGVLIVGALLWPLVHESICALFSKHSSRGDRSYAVATIGLLAYQIIYDNLFSELMWLPFSILYVWALLRKQRRRRQIRRAREVD